MAFNTAVQAYFKSLWGYNPKTDNEHTYRTPLENLLAAVCEELGKDIQPRHEVKDGQTQLGVPDFSFINKKNLGTVGLLENKKVGLDIEKLVGDKQVKKYRKRSENIILTNYHDWLLVRDGKVTHRANLGTIKDIQAKSQPDAKGVADLKNLLGAFLSKEPLGISRTKELAEQLALRCHDLRDFLTAKLKQQRKAKQDTRLVNMYAAFQEYVDSHLTEEDFADAFSQTLGYSLFLAKLNVPDDKTIDLYNVQKYIPTSFGLIRSLADFLKELEEDEYMGIRYRVEEIIGMMNHLHKAGIVSELAGQKKLDLDEERDPLIARDPFIYFYEHFLKEYDAEKRKDRGVYYTPPSVVHFIVRSVNHILKTQFGIADGLADHNEVQLLDFATGTGTFLHEVLQQMFEEPDIAGNPALQQSLVNDHVLKNFYGFEYLIAPYTIAHLKLSQFLRDKGFEINKPLNVYLTNTLQNQSKQKDFPFMQTLKEESNKAQTVKEMPIRVIVGNPPYSGASKNKGTIDDLTKEAYAPVDEKKMNWDDYVKFIRFAHHKMESMERGIIGVITNNNFLNAITLRQMRNRLMKDFNAIYILNLHGNSIIGETAPDGKPDKNVFDIRVGVAITFFVKTEKKPTSCNVYYAAIKSSSKREKWKQVVESDMNIFKPLDVDAFNNSFAKTRWGNRFEEHVSLFVPMEDEVGKLIAQYGDFWGLTDIFREYGSGVKTDRDELVINHDIATLEANMRTAFSGQYDAAFAEKYNITNSSSYKFADKLQGQDYDKSAIHTILYRPFDIRKIYYKVGFTSRPAWEIGQHMMADNYGLGFSRIVQGDKEYTEYSISNSLVDIHFIGGQGYMAHLYVQPANEKSQKHGDMFAKKEREENFTPAFRKWLDKKYDKKYTPEQVLGYIYAVLHSPAFRTRYQELLKLDFPRIPFVDNGKEFEALSALGWELVQTHLLKTVPDGVAVELKGKGDSKVTEIEYVEATQQLHINKTQYFTNVPPVAWHFTIGGYQVLEKYLKERKSDDRALGLTELRHIPKVVRILAWTDLKMQEIDTIFLCP